MINKEDKADVSRQLGKKVANKVSLATNDAKSKALAKAKADHSDPNKARRGRKPKGWYTDSRSDFEKDLEKSKHFSFR